MKTFCQLYWFLRRKDIRSYGILTICNLISVLLITAVAVIMESNTIRALLPGGDFRTQMTVIFALAAVGCVVFTLHTSWLFIRAKSREMGVYMALGIRKSRLVYLLCGDLALIATVSAVVGTALGTLLGKGVWQLFRTVIGSAEMALSTTLSAYLWPLGFALIITAAMCFMGWRFISGGNIKDIIHQQCKRVPVQNVKRWYGIVGILLIAVGVGGAVTAPAVPVGLLLTWLGLYMLLLFLAVRGLPGRRRQFNNIIFRSMIKLQGRLAIRNMCVIAVLLLVGYFAMFFKIRLQNHQMIEASAKGEGMTMELYWLLFFILSMICITTVIITTYICCLVIVEQNRHVYDSIRRLGARRDYLYHAIRSQVMSIFTLPIAMATSLIIAYGALNLYGSFGELGAGDLAVVFGMGAALLTTVSLLLWAAYRISLKKVCAILHIKPIQSFTVR